MRHLMAWDTETGERELDLDLENGTLRRLWSSEDGASLFVSGWWRIDKRDARTGELLRSIRVQDMPWGVAASPGEQLLAAGDGRSALNFLELAALMAYSRGATAIDAEIPVEVDAPIEATTESSSSVEFALSPTSPPATTLAPVPIEATVFLTMT